MTGLWLFIPTVVAVYSHNLNHTLIAAGIITLFMPLQLWVFAKWVWYIVSWLYRVAKRLLTRKAGKVTGGFVLSPAEGVQMLSEGSD